jgi:hypothetical protein
MGSAGSSPGSWSTVARSPPSPPPAFRLAARDIPVQPARLEAVWPMRFPSSLALSFEDFAALIGNALPSELQAAMFDRYIAPGAPQVAHDVSRAGAAIDFVKAHPPLLMTRASWIAPFRRGSPSTIFLATGSAGR